MFEVSFATVRISSSSMSAGLESMENLTAWFSIVTFGDWTGSKPIFLSFTLPSSVMPLILSAIGEVWFSDREPACVVKDGSGERLDLFLEGPEGPGEEGFAPAMLILVWMSALVFFLLKMDFPVSLDIVIFFINVARYITGISL